MKQTPLHALHVEQKAQMAEFAGYDMPIQYPTGVMTEHNWTRENAGIFDVSHMGQLTFEGNDVAKFLEKLCPSTFSTLGDNVAKYSVLMNEDGGMIDDLIVTKLSDSKFFAVVNGACKDKDIAWFKKHLPADITLTHHENRALIALQGPKSEKVLKEALDIDASDLNYMRYMEFGGRCWVSRLGYTGEDGFEISMPQEDAETAWNKLMAHKDVKPIGLAARDSLRLEMGYPLYGHDIDATTSPVEADSTWIMGKRENKDFIGADRVFKELEKGTVRKRVGVEITGRGVAREGAEVFDKTGSTKIGILTSGGFAPTLQKAIGQAYIETTHAHTGDDVVVRVRGRDIEARIADMPFVQAKTKKSVKKAA
ncbi:MAG: glycine cleavage system aminomethyltransferase GcvT [Alphaproteobacteria bacterium]